MRNRYFVMLAGIALIMDTVHLSKNALLDIIAYMEGEYPEYLLFLHYPLKI